MIIYRFFKYLYQNIYYTRILNKVYKQENILENLSQLYGTRFKKDWLGRIYAVLNPYIFNGNFNIDSQVYEYYENGPSNIEYIRQWIMEKLIVAEQFIKASNLFELLTYEIKDLGNDNYLFILKPISLDDCINYTKKFGILIAILLLILILIFLIW